MTAAEAKEVFRTDPEGNVMKRLEALEVARSVLGDNCTMAQIWKWCDEKEIVDVCDKR